MSSSPPFGQADLTNCERELIHLAGSIQPHGLLWVLQEPQLHIHHASANSGELLGRPLQTLLGNGLDALGGDIAERVRELATSADLHDGVPIRCRVAESGRAIDLEGLMHRNAEGALVLELEPLCQDAATTRGPALETVDLPGPQLLQRLSHAVQGLSEAASVADLANSLVVSLREMVGYDRVMVYKFDPEGHGEIIAEARDPRLDSLLGHHYPATDIPQRARELYLRNRVRVLVDVGYAPSALVAAGAGSATPLDMSMCYLRSMSPLHLQYLQNMGVTATLVVSLVREGRLWGLIACHHYRPRNLRLALRSASALLAEAATTRMAAIENFARAQVGLQVQRLARRLVEATASDGDWRPALFREPSALLQPLEATGVALFHDGQCLAAGEVPAEPQLRQLLLWIETQPFVHGTFQCASVERANPALGALTPLASGVLAVRLSAVHADYLVWLRKEQLQSVTWAGNPAKPIVGDDPLELSPRRSFAAWSELVRGTARPWTEAEVELARAYGAALVDIMTQVNAVRLLIAEHQVAEVRAAVADSREAVVVADADGGAFYANDAFLALAGCGRGQCADLEAMTRLFVDPTGIRHLVGQLKAERRAWRGELTLARGHGLMVRLRAEPVPARDGSLLGMVFIFEDLTESRRADAARHHLEASLSQAGRALRTGTPGRLRDAPDDLIAAILTNASLAAMDIVDSSPAPPAAPLLEELETSARRATLLYGHIRRATGGRSDD